MQSHTNRYLCCFQELWCDIDGPAARRHAHTQNVKAENHKLKKKQEIKKTFVCLRLSVSYVDV